MKIKAIPQTYDWQVVATWYGAEREVHKGSIFGCLRFVQENS